MRNETSICSKCSENYPRHLSGTNWSGLLNLQLLRFNHFFFSLISIVLWEKNSCRFFVQQIALTAFKFMSVSAGVHFIFYNVLANKSPSQNFYPLLYLCKLLKTPRFKLYYCDEWQNVMEILVDLFNFLAKILSHHQRFSFHSIFQT